jgi:internalin A
LEWWIKELQFLEKTFEDLAPLAGLTALQRLDLDGTQVSDVSPLAGLAALQHLNLDGTQIRDVSPLAGLTAHEAAEQRRT